MRRDSMPGDGPEAVRSSTPAQEQPLPPPNLVSLVDEAPASPSLTEPGPVHLPHNVGHAGFVAQESRQVDWFAGIILGPRLHLPAVAAAPLVREEAQVAVPGSGELAVGLRGGEQADQPHSWVPEEAGTRSTMENLPLNMLEGVWALP